MNIAPPLPPSSVTLRPLRKDQLSLRYDGVTWLFTMKFFEELGFLNGILDNELAPGTLIDMEDAFLTGRMLEDDMVRLGIAEMIARAMCLSDAQREEWRRNRVPDLFDDPAERMEMKRLMTKNVEQEEARFYRRLEGHGRLWVDSGGWTLHPAY